MAEPADGRKQGVMRGQIKISGDARQRLDVHRLRPT
jgi:hypothetical protein